MKNLRLYFWAPRHEVAYLQAITDAYEGLARVRTERHEGDRSLIMCLVQESRENEFNDLMRHLSLELSSELVPWMAGSPVSV